MESWKWQVNIQPPKIAVSVIFSSSKRIEYLLSFQYFTRYCVTSKTWGMFPLYFLHILPLFFPSLFFHLGGPQKAGSMRSLAVLRGRETRTNIFAVIQIPELPPETHLYLGPIWRHFRTAEQESKRRSDVKVGAWLQVGLGRGELIMS